MGLRTPLTPTHGAFAGGLAVWIDPGETRRRMGSPKSEMRCRSRSRPGRSSPRARHTISGMPQKRRFYGPFRAVPRREFFYFCTAVWRYHDGERSRAGEALGRPLVSLPSRASVPRAKHPAPSHGQPALPRQTSGGRGRGCRKRYAQPGSAGCAFPLPQLSFHWNPVFVVRNSPSTHRMELRR
jgi:hypothetical protein